MNETTFENLGLVMENNAGRVIWYFDEARHFFAQLGLYQKGSTRDESVLLSLYDGGEWEHGTASNKSTKFSMERTNLSLGGLTQTAHVLRLFNNADQMQSGLIPRFLSILLRPVRTSIREMREGGAAFQSKMESVINRISMDNKLNGRRYILLRKSKAFELFAQFHESSTHWIEKNQFKMSYQNAITMVSKSIGQVFRLSGIFTAFFLAWSTPEVQAFEKNSEELKGISINYAGNIGSPDDSTQEVYAFERSNEGGNIGSSDDVPISALSMRCALSLVSYSLNQNLIIQNIPQLNVDFDVSSAVPCIIDNAVSEEIEPIKIESATTAKRSETTMTYTTTITDVGKILLSGGKSI